MSVLKIFQGALQSQVITIKTLIQFSRWERI